MNLAMDATSKIFTSNLPYPNLECTVNFMCDSDSSISTDIVVVSNHPHNSWPLGFSNSWIVQSLAISDLIIWYGESIVVDLGQIFSMNGCSSSSSWRLYYC